MCLRPHSAGSTMLRLWPTGSSLGSLPLIATRWFSSSLSDPGSPQAPCPPEVRRWWLQVGLSVSGLSPSCLSSLSIPFHHLWPVRRYPHLRISARGLGLSGTSTHPTRQLSGTHYGLLRPSAPHRYSRASRLEPLAGLFPSHQGARFSRSVRQPDRAHAAYMPDAAGPQSGHPPRADPGGRMPPGFDIVHTLSTLHQRFTCVRLLRPA